MNQCICLCNVWTREMDKRVITPFDGKPYKETEVVEAKQIIQIVASAKFNNQSGITPYKLSIFSFPREFSAKPIYSITVGSESLSKTITVPTPGRYYAVVERRSQICGGSVQLIPDVAFVHFDGHSNIESVPLRLEKELKIIAFASAGKEFVKNGKSIIPYQLSIYPSPRLLRPPIYSTTVGIDNLSVIITVPAPGRYYVEAECTIKNQCSGFVKLVPDP